MLVWHLCKVLQVGTDNLRRVPYLGLSLVPRRVPYVDLSLVPRRLPYLDLSLVPRRVP